MNSYKFKRRREGDCKSPSKSREQKVQRLKQEDMFGGISSHSILLLCKVHNGAERTREGLGTQ